MVDAIRYKILGTFIRLFNTDFLFLKIFYHLRKDFIYSTLIIHETKNSHQNNMFWLFWFICNFCLQAAQNFTL